MFESYINIDSFRSCRKSCGFVILPLSACIPDFLHRLSSYYVQSNFNTIKDEVQLVAAPYGGIALLLLCVHNP
uniref:Uncharacterized protein n=1 Tax=Rhizophora mucronata TaxID=61149 RepID=A0A2P2PLP2_RHIMU